MSDQRLGVETSEFFLTNREGDDRNVFGVDALVGEFLVKRHVGVAIDCRDNGRLLTGRTELLHIGDDGLPIGMTERRVVLHDVGVFHTFRVEIGTQDFVGRARINVIRAE